MGIAREKKMKAELRQLKDENRSLHIQLGEVNSILNKIKLEYQKKQTWKQTEGGIIIPNEKK